MKINNVCAFLALLLLFSCKSNKVISPSEYKGNRMILSHGGGFAGTYKTYHILENGQVFKNTNALKKEATEALEGFDKDQVEQIFMNYKVLGLGQEKIQSYSNLNYSIVMINEKGEEHKLVWENGQKGSEKLKLFYSNVMNQIKHYHQNNGKPEAKQ